MQLIVYRGPIEKSRLNLLLPAITDIEDAKFVWIYPLELSESKKEAFNAFIRPYNLVNITILRDNFPNNFLIARRLGTLLKGEQFSMAHFIGFRSWNYSSSIRSQKKIWYVNGIPEELLLHTKSPINKLKCYFQWASLKKQRAPDLVVPVSENMGDLIKKRLYDSPCFVVPITVDTTVFKNTNSAKTYLTYLGSGAPWQALDLLAELWYQLFKMDNKLKFRIISRDPRCQILASKIPESNISTASGTEFSVVADYLSEAKLGFIVRRDDIVNRVSFPTKYGEYVASGAPVAATNLDWVISKQIKNYDTGVLLNSEMDITTQASCILDFLKRYEHDEERSERLMQSAESISNTKWRLQLQQHLNSIKPREEIKPSEI